MLFDKQDRTSNFDTRMVSWCIANNNVNGIERWIHKPISRTCLPKFYPRINDTSSLDPFYTIFNNLCPRFPSSFWYRYLLLDGVVGYQQVCVKFVSQGLFMGNWTVLCMVRSFTYGVIADEQNSHVSGVMTLKVLVLILLLLSFVFPLLFLLFVKLTI